MSGSIPLKIAGQDEILTKVFPDVSIPLSQTIFSSWNLTIVVSVILLLPLLALWMRTDEKVLVDVPQTLKPALPLSVSFRDRLENFNGFNIIFFLFFLVIFILRV